MPEENKTKKGDLLPIFFMGCIFILVYGMVLLLTNPFVEDAGVAPAFEDINDPMNIVYIIVIMLTVTFAILLIAKFWKEKLIQFIILGAVGYTSFYAFFLPILTIIFPNITIELLLAISIIMAALLVIALFKHPEWYVINISGIIVGVGAIIIFGISLGIFLILILMVALAIYDAISVYKTKHMIDLADTVMDLKLPVLLVIPKIRHYSLLKETKRLKQKIEEKEERDAFFLGLGDIVIPGILVAAVFHNIENSLPIVISVIAGILVGYAILMVFVIKGKPQAGLPCLCGGAIAGYLLSSYLIYGKLIGLNFYI